MPAEHFVPRFAKELNASSRVQANALKALAIANTPVAEGEWKERAAAALMIGAQWEGEDWKQKDFAGTLGVKEQQVAKHFEALAATLKKMGR